VFILSVSDTKMLIYYRDVVPDLAESFREFAMTCLPRAPLYADLANFIADEPKLLALMDDVPKTQRIPVLFMATTHFLLLAEPDAQLARYYPNVSTEILIDSPRTAFRNFVLDHAAEMRAVMATRSTQTNEVGRCAQFVAPMTLLNHEVGALAHIDVGTSAGLNLLINEYAYEYSYDYATGARVGGPSAVTIQCATRGAFPQINQLPDISWSIGLDASPIDVHNQQEVRWLEACVWPDQHDRFDRLVNAIKIAQSAEPRIVTGDAVNSIRKLVIQASEFGHPTLTTSWVMNYLTHDARIAFVHELDEIARDIDLSWIIAESPKETAGLPVNAKNDEFITVLSLVSWRKGHRTSQRLAASHPHGYWIHWGE
jgi:hypothetical protein